MTTETTKTTKTTEINAQPTTYTAEEIKKLRDFIESLKNDEDRSALACWGDHHDYSHGY